MERGRVQTVTGIIQIALGAIFLLSGASKLFSPSVLATSARTMLAPIPWLSGSLSLVARGVGIVELATAVMLSSPPTMRLGLIASAGLGCAFMAWAALAIKRKLDVSCGCFGGQLREQRLGGQNIVAGASIVTASAILLFFEAPRDPTIVAALTILAALVGVVLSATPPALRVIMNGLNSR